jgi:DNA-binding NarL/FixJ family response regulator
MAKTELNQFKAVLILTGVELERLTGHPDGFEIERNADELEEVRQSSEHALAVRHLDRESDQLRNVRAARVHNTGAKLRSSRRSTEEWRLTQHAPIHVLIVESHAILREGLATIINQQADMLVVGQATCGRETLQAFQAHQPDITLLDLRLPDVSGIETMMTLHAAFPSSRIVILTTSAADFDIKRALEAGADGYVLKSMPPSELIQTVRCVHAGKKHFPPAVAACLAEYFGDEDLTKRERQVLENLAAGHRNRDIGARLFIAEETVKVHVKHIMQKLRARDRTQAVVIGLRRGFISL